MMRVPRPRVVSVRHRHPGRVTPGDMAEVRLEPGLIALLESPAGGTRVSPGAGFQARYNVPVSVATTAAHALLVFVTREGTYWVGRDIEVEWFGAPGLGDTVLATARIEEANQRLARFTVSGCTLAGGALYRGTLRMAAMRAEYEGVRARLEEASRLQQAKAWPGGLRIAAPESIPMGRSGSVTVEVSNPEAHAISVAVGARLPFGAGLSLDSPDVQHLRSLRVRAGAWHS